VVSVGTTRFYIKKLYVFRAFAKLCRATISSVMSVRLSVRPSTWNNSAPIGRIFTKFICGLLEKSVEKIYVSLKLCKNKGYFRYFQMKSCRENQNTHFVFSNSLFENRAVYEIMWKNIVQPDRPQMTIWRMRITRWIPKDTNTHTGCVIRDLCLTVHHHCR
jgi:hypothetical protein